MLNTDEVIEFLRNHRQTLKSDFRIVKLGLIGSFARGEQTEDSDIDLLVEFEPDTDDIFGKKMKLKNLLKASFERDVDVCREKYIKPYIKSYLLKEVIYV
ncbi:MAG: nucleotidyltransferase domain-containing protein [candidate division KSB1 bacterium]|nr:nucleotidyltransferase domain-containing protein [candidate division KSB1 bacterium]MDZ7301843.1 nucleotidyltransferase domain-containing protein [candidate division KSB1 bacterium]MDZ7310226.1 nucleotidyltransferase domain-containing protein [candidate division KSB1 bacterium]